ncbi:MAG: hypothetical protein FWC73_02950 [Defluviitaleaceae bacterium]|nr:hypothetical protein [Defluviitaleaceae bacterium]
MGRRGGGRMGGGFGGGRSSGGRGFGSGGARPGGSFGGGSRPGGGLGGLGGGRPGAGRGMAPRPAPRRGGVGSFGAGMGVGMGLGMMGGRRRRGWGGGWGMGRRRRMMGGPMMMGGGGGGCSGCFGGLLAIILVIIVLAMIGMFSNFAFPIGGGASPRGVTSSRQVTPSTVSRTALPRGSADSSVPMYVDHLGLIRNSTAANRGLTNFHDRTGVRPILYIVGPAQFGGENWPSDAQLEIFAQDAYSSMTDNEAHLLLLFFYNGNPDGYAMWNIAGRQSLTVMDGEAWDILMDYVELYFYQNMQWHDRFSRAFDEASQRIMTVTRSAWIPVLVVAGILLILLLLFRWWRSKQEQKNAEAEQLERVLAQPLETMGNPSDPASQLAQQYTDDNNDNS